MNRSLISAAMTLGVILGTYSLYSVAVVPIVEPRKEIAEPKDEPTQVNYQSNAARRVDGVLETYFSKAHWTAKQEYNLLQTPQMLMVYGKHTETKDQGVILSPCALIFFPGGLPSGEELPNNAIVVESPEAEVRFEGGFKPAQGKIGRFDEASLPGEVTIRSSMKEPGPEDDLLVHTRNVKINERLILTDEVVDFQLGTNHGKGRKLEIRFLPAALAEGNSSGGVDIGGVQWIEILEDVELMLYSEGKELFPTTPNSLLIEGEGAQTTPPNETSPPVIPSKEAEDKKLNDSPLHVTCAGSFYFDLTLQRAEFERNVLISRANPSGPPDSLTSQKLYIYFAKAAKQKLSKNSSDPTGSNLGSTYQPIRLVAEGAPVEVQIPSSDANVRCEVLTYQPIEKKLTISVKNPGRSVTLTIDSLTNHSTIQSPVVVYTLDPSDPKRRLGSLRAAGPGTLNGFNPQKENATFLATWEKEILMQRQEGQSVLSFFGTPHIFMNGLGDIRGDEMHVWILELPPNGPPKLHSREESENRPVIIPDRLRVIGNVQVTSPQLRISKLGELQIWLDHLDLGQDASLTQEISAEPNRPESNSNSQNALFKNHNKKNSDVYEVEAKLLQINVMVDGMATNKKRPLTEVKHLTATGDVRVKQFPSSPTAGEGMNLNGEFLDIRNANAANAVIRLHGKQSGTEEEMQANISGNGATAKGRAMIVDREQNRLQIPSAGKLLLPIEKDMQGRPLPQPELAEITWKDQLIFNGAKADFLGGVLIKGSTGWLRANQMSVTLAQPFQFDPATKTRPEIDRIICDGDVLVEQSEFEGADQISFTRFSIPWLSISHVTGEIDGRGQGWLQSTRYASSSQLLPPGVGSNGIVSQASARNRPRSSDARLGYMRLDFLHGLRGNAHAREVTAIGQVHAIYGPVDTWQQTIVYGGEGWREECMALDCDRVTVRHLKGGVQGDDWAEVHADGNVILEGIGKNTGILHGQAERLTYDQRKDLLILSGGSNESHLWSEGTSKLPVSNVRAKEIKYWIAKGQVEGEKMSSIDFSNFPDN